MVTTDIDRLLDGRLKVRHLVPVVTAARGIDARVAATTGHYRPAPV